MRSLSESTASIQSSPRPADTASAELVRHWYAEHGEALYRYLRFHLPSADLADDLTAEVFLRAVRASDQYDPARGPARPWLFRIAQNVLRDHHRRAGRRREVPMDQFRDLVWEAPSIEERLLHEEEVALLLEALQRLPETDRELVGLRYGSGLSGAEIGELLGVTEQVVRTRLWRALRRLRGVLQG